MWITQRMLYTSDINTQETGNNGSFNQDGMLEYLCMVCLMDDQDWNSRWTSNRKLVNKLK